MSRPDYKLPRKGSVLTIGTMDKSKVRVRFNDLVGNYWHCRLIRGQLSDLSTGTMVGIQAVLGEELYDYRALISKKESHGKRIIFSRVSIRGVRPLRQSERAPCELPVLIELPGCVYPEIEASHRRNNRLLNLSYSGALLASQHALPSEADQILLFFNLDGENGNVSHLLIRAAIKWRAECIGEPMPCRYGLEFFGLLPFVQDALFEYVEMRLLEEEGFHQDAASVSRGAYSKTSRQ